MRFCDIHCHVLPGLDDGPETLDETLAMLHSAWEGGTRSIVATPHLYADFFPGVSPAAVRETYAATIAELDRLGRKTDFAFLRQIRLHQGAEHFCDVAFLEALERGEVVPINDGPYLLVELPPSLPEEPGLVAARRIVAAGYRPVLAHVERYGFVQRTPQRLRRFIDLGCIIQVNADGSRRFGGSERFQRRLLGSGLVHVLASDGHGVARRPPELGPLSSALAARFTGEAVTRWAWSNPRAIVGGAAL